MAFAGFDFHNRLQLLEFMARETAPPDWHPMDERWYFERLDRRTSLESEGLPDLSLVPTEGYYARWKRVHQSCVDDHLKGLPNNRTPDSSATSDIMTVAYREGVDETLLAVTWTSESAFGRAPMSNGNGRDKRTGEIRQEFVKIGNADVGPMQINFRTWHAFEPVKEFETVKVFGLTTTGYRDFDGDYFTNLRAGARILKYLNSKYDRAEAAARYRAGEGEYADTPDGKASLKARKERFNSLKDRYHKFFKCIKDRR